MSQIVIFQAQKRYAGTKNGYADASKIWCSAHSITKDFDAEVFPSDQGISNLARHARRAPRRCPAIGMPQRSKR
ncbi:hypothetical protein [Burkholderia glumae]|uniref:hypothetical protein n=1 Tax=Burkholderia glumae TaxID=337 RepID=UPI00146419E6|nr:hypothetical protein [Burkholderia glumae]QJP71171.1 hypothetical protein HJC54_27950 [Burkholderia glumae]